MKRRRGRTNQVAQTRQQKLGLPDADEVRCKVEAGQYITTKEMMSLTGCSRSLLVEARVGRRMPDGDYTEPFMPEHLWIAQGGKYGVAFDPAAVDFITRALRKRPGRGGDGRGCNAAEWWRGMRDRVAEIVARKQRDMRIRRLYSLTETASLLCCTVETVKNYVRGIPRIEGGKGEPVFTEGVHYVILDEVPQPCSRLFFRPAAIQRAKQFQRSGDGRKVRRGTPA